MLQCAERNRRVSIRTGIEENMDSKLQTKNLILDHFKRYPELQIRDIFKFLHQSSFGCEHLLADPSAAVDYIRKEAKTARPHAGEFVEELDGEYCRVHLDILKEALTAETFGKLFFLSARHQEDGRAALEEKLSVTADLIAEGLLPFDRDSFRSMAEEWRTQGYPAIHHSEEFRAAYAPAYRVIRKEYALFLPLFAQIDRMKNERNAGCNSKSLILAVEGGSASGKSTLGNLLEQVYGCTLFHMDDFFLRPEQRTPERFAEPGGNVDRERFAAEVLEPLSRGEVVAYRRFDCSTFTILPPVEIKASEFTVIEGAYSMHPELSGYYDYSVFLDVDPEVQKKRIRKRNSAELAERFFAEWIPLEHVYFDVMKVKERCDMVVGIKN